MIAPEQFDNWFSHHRPDDETLPKYVAIRDAGQNIITIVTQLVATAAYTPYDRVTWTAGWEEINRVTRLFAETIDAHAPDSADKTAAIRCVRLARSAYIEWWVRHPLPPEQNEVQDIDDLLLIAGTELAKARWQASSAIACGGK